MSDKITVLSIEKYKGRTYRVEFEEREPVYLHSSVISDFHLKADMQIPESALEEIIFADEYRRAKERALYLFDYRDHSYKELFDKLRHNYSVEVCNAVMDKMTELGLIDDRRYAKLLARQLFEIKRVGKYKAKAEMLKKGIDKEIIDELLEEYEDDTSERLYELVEKKYARYLTDEKGIKKVFSALVRNGYSYSETREVIKQFLDEVDFNGD